MEPNELPDDLASIRYLHTYTAPIGYFDELTAEIVSKINLPLSAELPFSKPPANYFDELAQTVLQRIKNESSTNEIQKELEEIEPLLAHVPKTNVYSVPTDYFDSFQVAIPTNKKPAAVLKMKRRTSWLNYAAAAVVAVVIGTGVFLFVNNEGSDADTTRYTAALSRIPDNEISDYLDRTSVDADIVPPSPDSYKAKDSESLFKLLLNNVSDNEIEDYLNANDDGDEKDIKGI